MLVIVFLIFYSAEFALLIWFYSIVITCFSVTKVLSDVLIRTDSLKVYVYSFEIIILMGNEKFGP